MSTYSFCPSLCALLELMQNGVSFRGVGEKMDVCSQYGSERRPTVERHHERAAIFTLIPQCDLFQLVQDTFNIQRWSRCSGIGPREQRSLPVLKVVEVEGFTQSQPEYLQVGVPCCQCRELESLPSQTAAPSALILRIALKSGQPPVAHTSTPSCLCQFRLARYCGQSGHLEALTIGSTLLRVHLVRYCR